MIDAAGAIYVIGGYGNIYLNDVWASTDGGARPDLAGGVLEGYWAGTQGYYRGTRVVLWGLKWYLGGTGAT